MGRIQEIIKEHSSLWHWLYKSKEERREYLQNLFQNLTREDLVNSTPQEREKVNQILSKLLKEQIKDSSGKGSAFIHLVLENMVKQKISPDEIKINCNQVIENGYIFRENIPYGDRVHTLFQLFYGTEQLKHYMDVFKKDIIERRDFDVLCRFKWNMRTPSVLDFFTEKEIETIINRSHSVNPAAVKNWTIYSHPMNRKEIQEIETLLNIFEGADYFSEEEKEYSLSKLQDTKAVIYPDIVYNGGDKFIKSRKRLNEMAQYTKQDLMEHGEYPRSRYKIDSMIRYNSRVGSMILNTIDYVKWLKDEEYIELSANVINALAEPLSKNPEIDGYTFAFLFIEKVGESRLSELVDAFSQENVNHDEVLKNVIVSVIRTLYPYHSDARNNFSQLLDIYLKHNSESHKLDALWKAVCQSCNNDYLLFRKHIELCVAKLTEANPQFFAPYNIKYFNDLHRNIQAGHYQEEVNGYLILAARLKSALKAGHEDTDMVFKFLKVHLVNDDFPREKAEVDEIMKLYLEKYPANRQILLDGVIDMVLSRPQNYNGYTYWDDYYHLGMCLDTLCELSPVNEKAVFYEQLFDRLNDDFWEKINDAEANSLYCKYETYINCNPEKSVKRTEKLWRLLSVSKNKRWVAKFLLLLAPLATKDKKGEVLGKKVVKEITHSSIMNDRDGFISVVQFFKVINLGKLYTKEEREGFPKELQFAHKMIHFSEEEIGFLHKYLSSSDININLYHHIFNKLNDIQLDKLKTDTYIDKPHLTALAASVMYMFGKDFQQYFDKVPKSYFDNYPDVTLVDLCGFLPEENTLSDPDRKELKEFLMKHVYDVNNKLLRPSNELQMICSAWTKLSCEERKYGYKDLLRAAVEKKCSYTGMRNIRFAKEAFACGVSDQNYLIYEDIYLAGQYVPVPFDTKKRFKGIINGSELVGHFLPRSDARAASFGQYTDCCQHLGYGNSLGGQCAISTMIDPYSQVFVIENKSGEIVAGSFVWYTKDKSIPPHIGVCFDNVEAKGGFANQEVLNDIYEQATDWLCEEKGCMFVTIGKRYGDINLEKYPEFEKPLIPNYYKKYSDAITGGQKLIKENKNAQWNDNRNPYYIRPYAEEADKELHSLFPERSGFSECKKDIENTRVLIKCDGEVVGFAVNLSNNDKPKVYINPLFEENYPKVREELLESLNQPVVKKELRDMRTLATQRKER